MATIGGQNENDAQRISGNYWRQRISCQVHTVVLGIGAPRIPSQVGDIDERIVHGTEYLVIH